jgi:ABC-type polysaccharide/polyol phosphate export permease
VVLVLARSRRRRHRRLGALVKRILFPAEVLPLVSVLANLINMLLSLPLLFGFLLVFGIRPHAVLLFLPLLLVLQFLLTTGLAGAGGAQSISGTWNRS